MRIGVLGGGQLGRMLALAGYRLGFELRCFDTSPEACAGQVAPLQTGSFEDLEALSAFAEGLDVVTLEWENIPLPVAEHLAARVPFYPPPRALEASQDRLTEKQTLRSLGIETAAFAAVQTRTELESALRDIGLPGILKTRRGGYDGLGQATLHSAGEAQRFLETHPGQPLIYEGFVQFERELSIIAARSTRGEVAFYPLVQNTHRAGILRLTQAPAPNLTPALQDAAEDIARRLLDALDYTGILSIELFQADERLLVNEIAPRVHNSGHWSIDGAVTSQFENHLRAIAGLPLGDCTAIGTSSMVNLIGAHPPVEDMLDVPGARLHLYGKTPRPGRKIGHVTVSDTDAEHVRSSSQRLMEMTRAYEA